VFFLDIPFYRARQAWIALRSILAIHPEMVA